MLNKFHHDFHMKSLFLPKCSLLWLHVNVLKSNLKFSASLGEAVVLSGFQEPGFLSLELRAQRGQGEHYHDEWVGKKHLFG